MKKIFLIILLCFIVAFAAFAVDMSPHPGDSLDMILTVQDDIVIMSQAAPAPAYENILYLEQFNYNNEICMADYDNINGYHYLNSSGSPTALTVSYIGYEMEIDNLYKPGEDVAIYKTEFG